MEKKIKIYLCDFVHNYSGTGTFMFPLNIGYIAAYANKFYSDKIDIKLFKFPQNFMKEFKKEIPDLVGFSNYLWSANVNNKFSEWIKSVNPNVIIVYGGPDINCSKKGYKKFFTTHESADFYIPYQGETSFVNLLKEIFKKGLNINDLKSKPIDGVVYYKDNIVIKGRFVPRIKNPDSIPSPYLTGLLDKFFDTNLIPISETNRGCPYTCTYCAQGLSSHNQMQFFSLERVKDELKYIANKVKNTNIFMFADSNFGIVERDIEIARFIAKLKKETGYPRKFNTNWAKNQPKIFEIAKILDNINLLVSLQSLDKKVLKNIKRQNIEIPVFKDIINKINSAGGMSGTEIILGLPGETKESHLNTIRTLFDWNASYIICYIAMLLDGSELSLLKETGEFKCTTKFRYLDNGFGNYDGIISVEAEEGIRSTSTISEEDMLYFRPVHWIIQFLWNYRFGYPLLKYLQSLGINQLDYILKLLDQFKDSNTSNKIKKIFDDFKEEANKEWFDSKEDLEEFFSKPENFKALEQGQYGKLNGKYIFRILLEAREDFEKCLYNAAINFSSLCHSKKQIIKDIIKFLSASIIDFNNNIDDISKERTIDCNYNILEWTNSRYKENLEDFYSKEGIKLSFYLPEEQKQALKILLKQYAHKNKNVTLRKMSEFMDIRDCFRKACLAQCA